jgi:hypothetical protein
MKTAKTPSKWDKTLFILEVQLSAVEALINNIDYLDMKQFD